MRFGRVAIAMLPVLLAGAVGCKPNLGAPPSLIEGPRMLAIRGVPAEARPGEGITYDALVVDNNGRIDASDTLGWSLCLEPHPPAESNIVNSACLTNGDTAAGATFMAPLPSDACMLFGPVTPIPKPGQPPTRPADPDVTGGFYQPVRLVWYHDDTSEIGFTLQRVLCPLANAAIDVRNRFTMEYVPNVNPVIDSLTLDPDGAATVLFAAGQAAPPPAATVTVGQTVTLEARWPDGGAETFPVYDIATRDLVTQHESMRLAWFATGGRFEHDRTGRTDAEFDATTTRNVWVAPDALGTVHLWIVLRDSRGGLDFAESTFEVGP